jgi:AraC family transcriptional regulator, positive regulator of tynA and feaB
LLQSVSDLTVAAPPARRSAQGDSMQVSSFSSSTEEGCVQCSSFQETLNNAVAVRFRVRPKSSWLDFRMTTYASPRLQCADIRFSPHSTSLLPGQARTKASSFLLSYQAEGHATVAQGDRETSVRPGEFFLIDTDRPFAIETTVVRTKSVYIPGDCLRDALPEIDLCTAVAVPAGRILGSVVDELFELAPGLDDIAAGRFAAALPHVLVVALDSHLRCSESASRRPQARHRERIRKFVRQHLRDPSLDCRTIANKVNLSRRYIHELFAAEETTLMSWIWSERLKRAGVDLANPLLAKRTIATIAYDWGFSDPAHFSRAFKAAYKVSPRAFRRTRGTIAMAIETEV